MTESHPTHNPTGWLNSNPALTGECREYCLLRKYRSSVSSPELS